MNTSTTTGSASVMIDPEDYFGTLLIELTLEQDFEDIPQPTRRGISPNKEYRRGEGQMTKKIRKKGSGDTIFMYPGYARVLEGEFSRHNCGRKSKLRK